MAHGRIVARWSRRCLVSPASPLRTGAAVTGHAPRTVASVVSDPRQCAQPRIEWWQW